MTQTSPISARHRLAGTTAALITSLAAPYQGLAGTAATAPSFNCAKASGQVEQLICSDASLAALDRQMASTYAKAMRNWPAAVAKEQQAFQIGWIKGRNDCWKADNQKACVREAYQSRLVELQIKGGLVEAPTAVGYSCKSMKQQPVMAAFYNNTNPKAAVLTVGDDLVIAVIAPSGSGARYTASNVEFWEHQGTATIQWFGKTLSCTPRAHQ